MRFLPASAVAAATLFMSCVPTGSVTAAPVPTTVGFKALTVPVRVLDTRDPASFDGQSRLNVSSLSVPVRSRAGLSVADSVAVVNVVAVNATTAGFITVWAASPDGSCSTPPVISTTNFVAAGTRANMTLARIGGLGRICVFSNAEVDVVIDVTGSMNETGDRFTPVTPTRLVDTRNSGRRTFGTVMRVTAPGPAGMSSVAVNVTSVHPDTDGFLTVYPADASGACQAPPTTSTVNTPAGMIRPGATFVGVSNNAFCVFWFTGGDVVVDLFGTFSPNGQATYLAHDVPRRAVDNRSMAGWGPNFDPGRIQIRSPYGGGILNFNGVEHRLAAYQFNVTAVAALQAGFMFAAPYAGTGALQPTTSDTSIGNFAPGEVAANAVVAVPKPSVVVGPSAPSYMVIDELGVWWET